MLGSITTCPYCDSPELRRNVLNKTTQCMKCLAVLEERMHDLVDFYAKTEMEEVHCAVTPDFLSGKIVDDEIDEDPYCTRGFISAFRMLSSLREPVYATTARTCHGALAEMERQIGDSLYGGYIGYNGRQPGATKELKAERTEEDKQPVGDARHTLVAYFQVHEVASICGIDKEIADLGVRCFRHAASRTSLRNRNVESMATAALVCALERTRAKYAPVRAVGGQVPHIPTLATVSEATGIPDREIFRYLKLVNSALHRQVRDASSAVTNHMPDFIRDLNLHQQTHQLAGMIASSAIQHNICSRRPPLGVTGAAVNVALFARGEPRNEPTIADSAGIPESSLRKICKELCRHGKLVVPEEYWVRVDSHPWGNAKEEKESDVEMEPRLDIEEEEDADDDDHGGLFPPGAEVGPFGNRSFMPPPPPPLLPKHVVDPTGEKPAHTSLVDVFMQFARGGMFPRGVPPSVPPPNSAGDTPPLPPPLPDLQTTGVPSLQGMRSSSDPAPHTTITMDIAKEVP